MPRMTTDIRFLPLNLGLFRGDLKLPGFKDPAHVSRRRRAIIFRLVALCIRAASVGGVFQFPPRRATRDTLTGTRLYFALRNLIDSLA